MAPEQPAFNLTLNWPDGRTEVYRVHNPEPVAVLPYAAPHCWGIDPALCLIGVHAQRVRIAGGQLTGTCGDLVLLGAPVSALASWAVAPA